jgi:hypothetical protein
VASARIQVLYGYPVIGATRSQPKVPDEPVQFGWRLIGGNNRELARGAQSYETYTDVHQAVQSIQIGISTLDWPVRNDARTGKWHWQAESAGTALIAGGRSYERERDCRDCIQHVRVAFVDVTITPGVIVLRPNRAVVTLRPMTQRGDRTQLSQDAS